MKLFVDATAAKPLCYMWKRNGKNIASPKCSGVGTCTLTIDSFTPEHEGEYTCIVSDDEKNVKSNSAELKLGKQLYNYVTI